MAQIGEAGGIDSKINSIATLVIICKTPDRETLEGGNKGAISSTFNSNRFRNLKWVSKQWPLLAVKWLSKTEGLSNSNSNMRNTSNPMGIVPVPTKCSPLQDPNNLFTKFQLLTNKQGVVQLVRGWSIQRDAHILTLATKTSVQKAAPQPCQRGTTFIEVG